MPCSGSSPASGARAPCPLFSAMALTTRQSRRSWDLELWMGQNASALPASFLPMGCASHLGLRAEGSAAATSLAAPLRFLFFFPPEDGPTWGSETLASLASGWPDCRSRASAALAHLSARVKSSVGDEITLVASFSAILRSHTPRRKAMQTDSPEILAIVFRHWKKRCMYLRRDSPLRCCTW